MTNDDLARKQIEEKDLNQYLIKCCGYYNPEDYDKNVVKLGLALSCGSRLFIVLPITIYFLIRIFFVYLTIPIQRVHLNVSKVICLWESKIWGVLFNIPEIGPFWYLVSKTFHNHSVTIYLEGFGGLYSLKYAKCIEN